MQGLSILYEDNHLIAVNKRPADIVQGDKTGDATLADKVRDYIRESRGKTGEVFVGIPHRLDRPTSGVVLFARTSKALARLSEMFRDGKVDKIYWAMVLERPPAEAGTLVHWLTRNSEQNKSYAAEAPRPGARKPGFPTACFSAWSATISWRSGWKRAGITRSGPSFMRWDATSRET